jgi:hypothetical protein
MRTAKQQAEERRAEKLAEVKRQVSEGTLVVRKMTKAEMKEAAERRAERAAA